MSLLHEQVEDVVGEERLGPVARPAVKLLAGMPPDESESRAASFTMNCVGALGRDHGRARGGGHQGRGHPAK
eukprot:5421467-Pleurochrysis_carterae.AAC.2